MKKTRYTMTIDESDYDKIDGGDLSPLDVFTFPGPMKKRISFGTKRIFPFKAGDEIEMYEYLPFEEKFSGRSVKVKIAEVEEQEVNEDHYYWLTVDKQQYFRDGEPIETRFLEVIL